MKRMLSLCLALCMAFALAAPGFAEAAEAPLAEAPLADAAPEAEAPLVLENVEQAVLDSSETLDEEPLEDAKAAGNNISKATPIGVNTWVDGYTATADQTDYYRFTLPQDGVVSFSFRHAQEDSTRYWSVLLLTKEQDVTYYYFFRSLLEQNIFLKDSAEITSPRIGLPAGTYYIKVATQTHPSSYPSPPLYRSYGVRANFAAFGQWETEENNSTTEADSIQPGMTYYASTTDTYDTDYFKFKVPYQGKVTLTFNHVPENSRSYWSVSIGTSESSFSSVVNKNIFLSSDASTVLSATLPVGTYYIKIASSDKSLIGREYNFKVTTPADPVQVRAFATRLYNKCLGRQPDSGIETWVRVLSDGSWTAERVAWGFVFSKEYTNKHTSNDAYVRMLYRVYMDREADASGYNTWINALNSGWSREQVMQGFSRSVEFKNICARYGMTPW